MKNIFYNIIFVLSVCFFTQCQEVPVAIPEFQVPTTNKVVLLEDLTGVRCPNCPRGAAAIESILTKYKGKVVAVGIHGSFLTKPLAESKYDFRNEKAIALEELLKPFIGKPSIQVNRVQFPGELFTSVATIDLWDGFVAKELQKEQEMEILATKTYNKNTRKLDLNFSAVSILKSEGPFKISVYITESKIIDPQETQGKIIQEFEHNHVLRDMLTAANGDRLAESLLKSESVQKSYSYIVPENFKPENMEVVVMVSKDKGSDKTVIQAKGIKVVE
jgi:hypothetical protein